jgi:hypothetical protein
MLIRVLGIERFVAPLEVTNEVVEYWFNHCEDIQ